MFIEFRTFSEAIFISFSSSFATSKETSCTFIMGSVDRDPKAAEDSGVHFPSNRSVLGTVVLSGGCLSDGSRALGDMLTDMLD